MAKKKANMVGIRCGKGDFLFDESFNSLAINLKYITKQSDCVVTGITSYFSGEGKSTVSYNLAYTLAEHGKKVLLIDADLRRGRIHKYFEEERENGLADYLCGRKKANQIIRKSKVEGLDYIVAGKSSENPIKLLDKQELVTLVEGLKKNYDWIFIDTAPIGMVADALLVMKVVDGALLVLDQKKSRKHDVAKAIDVLSISGVDLLGFVINNADSIKTPGSGSRYSKYSKYSKYSRYGYYAMNKANKD